MAGIRTFVDPTDPKDLDRVHALQDAIKVSQINISAKKDDSGAVTVQFGGCDGQIPNCLPTTPGWNYWVRLYRPRAEILTGKWKFPQSQAVN